MKYQATYDEHEAFHIIHRKGFDAELRDFFLPKPGKKTYLTIEVKKKKSTRTLSQNAYWWAVPMVMVRDRLRELSGEKWISKETAHGFILDKVHYLEIVDENTGLVERIRRETRDLSKSEYGDLIDSAIEWCDMYLDIKIPLPDTQSMLDFEKADREYGEQGN